MKKFILVFFLTAVMAAGALGERATEVALRYSVQDTLVRIVFESDDDTIGRATVATTPTFIKIVFPARIDLKQQKDLPFDLNWKDRTVLITPRDVADIRAYRLTMPSRIVIDLKVTPKAQKEAPKAEQRPEQKQPPSPAPQPSPTRQPVPPAMPSQKAQPVQKSPEPSAARPAEQAVQEKGKRVRVVMIDAGHGGYDSGISSGDAKEKDVNLVVAKDLYNALSKKGFTVLMTRRVDQPASLSERINFAGAKNPEVFISIHASSSERLTVYTASAEDLSADAVKGYDTAYRQSRHLAKSRNLARSLSDALSSDLSADIFRQELPLPLLTGMNTTAVMIDYPSVKGYATDAKLREKFVNAVVRGISSHEQ